MEPETNKNLGKYPFNGFCFLPECQEKRQQSAMKPKERLSLPKPVGQHLRKLNHWFPNSIQLNKQFKNQVIIHIRNLIRPPRRNLIQLRRVDTCELFFLIKILSITVNQQNIYYGPFEVVMEHSHCYRHPCSDLILIINEKKQFKKYITLICETRVSNLFPRAVLLLPD